MTDKRAREVIESARCLHRDFPDGKRRDWIKCDSKPSTEGHVVTLHVDCALAALSEAGIGTFDTETEVAAPRSLVSCIGELEGELESAYDKEHAATPKRIKKAVLKLLDAADQLAALSDQEDE